MTVTVRAPAAVTLVLTPAKISEKDDPDMPGDQHVATVTATVSPASATAFTVTVSAAAVSPAVADDYDLSTNTTLSFAANATTSTGTVTITAVDNDVDAADKTVTVTGTTTSAVTVNEVTLTIADDDEVPGAPGDLEAEAGDGQVELSWTAPDAGTSDITGYEYRYKTTGDYPDDWTAVPDGDDAGSETNDETGVTATGLTNGTAYTFELRAVSAAGNGAAGTSAEITPTAPVAPGAPDLKAAPGGRSGGAVVDGAGRRRQRHYRVPVPAEGERRSLRRVDADPRRRRRGHRARQRDRLRRRAPDERGAAHLQAAGGECGGPGRGVGGGPGHAHARDMRENGAGSRRDSRPARPARRRERLRGGDRRPPGLDQWPTGCDP